MEKNNIILNQFIDNGKIEIREFSPEIESTYLSPLYLTLDSSFSVKWTGLVQDNSVLVDNRIKDTEIFYKCGRLGIGREPLLSYRFDIAVSENQITTAFHIGDGKFGLSFGNGTNDGYLPEIIGMGRTESDAGLYILGRSGNNKGSGIPLIVIDGRGNGNKKITNRPILGVTNSDYSDYLMTIDFNGNVGIGKKPQIYRLEVNGSIESDDLVIDGSSLKAVIKELQQEISFLKTKIVK